MNNRQEQALLMQNAVNDDMKRLLTFANVFYPTMKRVIADEWKKQQEDIAKQVNDVQNVQADKVPLSRRAQRLNKRITTLEARMTNEEKKIKESLQSILEISATMARASTEYKQVQALLEDERQERKEALEKEVELMEEKKKEREKKDKVKVVKRKRAVISSDDIIRKMTNVEGDQPEPVGRFNNSQQVADSLM